MNLSLRNRVAVSFIIANLVVLIISFTVFQFLNSLNKDIEELTFKTNRVSLLTDEIRISAVMILKRQRELITKGVNEDRVEKIISLCESFSSLLHTLDGYYKETEVKKIVAKMISYVDSLRLVLSKVTVHSRDNLGVTSISELADKILDTFSELQDIQIIQAVERDKKVKNIINETKRNMMISLIIGFLGTIILGLVVPGKIALPFRKIKDAIRELQDCNFDVSIYYNQDDEIGEIAREMNKMIHSFKVFDELRTDRISVELRKFDVLANMVKKPILVGNAERKLIYMNNKMYNLLQFQSDDFMGKEIEDTLVPVSIKESFDLALKRRSKIENAEIKIMAKKEEESSSEGSVSTENLEINESGEDISVSAEREEELIFNGYANVIPIRGKDSSLDYYLMVLSTEVFS